MYAQFISVDFDEKQQHVFNVFYILIHNFKVNINTEVGNKCIRSTWQIVFDLQLMLDVKFT